MVILGLLATCGSIMGEHLIHAADASAQCGVVLLGVLVSATGAGLLYFQDNDLHTSHAWGWLALVVLGSLITCGGIMGEHFLHAALGLCEGVGHCCVGICSALADAPHAIPAVIGAAALGAGGVLMYTQGFQWVDLLILVIGVCCCAGAGVAASAGARELTGSGVNEDCGEGCRPLLSGAV